MIAQRTRVAIVLLLVTVASGARGEDLSSKLPHLGEHTFVPTGMVAEPFITTHMRNSTGFGQAKGIQVPSVVVNDSLQLGTLKADLVFLGLGFAYQHAVKDWLAVGATVSGAGRLGSDQESLISQGVTGYLRYDLQWLMRIRETKRTVLSADLRMENQTGTFVNLLEWAQRIIDEGELSPSNSLVQTRSSLRGAGGVRFAWGIRRALGLLSSFNLGYGETLDLEGSNKWTFDAALGLSLDFSHHTRFPVGLVVSGRLNNIAEGGKDLESAFRAWAVELAYTGRPDFTVGLKVGNESTRIETFDQTVHLTEIRITLRYFF
jgi:hypothetical protein